MSNMIYKTLKGERICLQCRHLYKETENKSERICECENPVLAPAELVCTNPITEIRQMPEYKTNFMSQ